MKLTVENFVLSTIALAVLVSLVSWVALSDNYQNTHCANTRTHTMYSC